MADEGGMKETSHGSLREDSNEERLEGSNEDKEMSNGSGSREGVDKEGRADKERDQLRESCVQIRW